MSRRLSIRGVAAVGERLRVFFFDSNIMNTGWLIEGIQCCNAISGRSDVDAILHTTDSTYTVPDWTDNRVVSYLKRNVNSGTDETIIDHDHVIVGNLYLTNLANDPVSYIVTLKEIKIDASENIMYQLKEVAQNVDNP